MLTDLIFIKRGRVVLDATMEQVQHTFSEVEVNAENIVQARELRPISERMVLGASLMLFEDVSTEQLKTIGKVRASSITDLFIAKMSD